jgi:hypothetical protein
MHAKHGRQGSLDSSSPSNKAHHKVFKKVITSNLPACTCLLVAAFVQDLDRDILKELVAALKDLDEDSDAMEAADRPDETAGLDLNPSSDECDEADGDHDDTSDHGQTGNMHRGLSRLARAALADEAGRCPARAGMSGIDALLMVVEAELDEMDAMDATDAMDTAGDDVTRDRSGMSEQPSDAVDDGPTDAADDLQAAAPSQEAPMVTNTAAGLNGSGMPVVPRRFSFVELLQSDEEPVPQPQPTQGMQQQQVSMASNPQVAPLAVAPLHTGLTGPMIHQAQVQLQHTLQLSSMPMQQPAALQMLLQQHALSGFASILSQGKLMSVGLNSVPQAGHVANRAAGNAAAAPLAMPPALTTPIASSRVVLPPVEPLRLAHAAAAPNGPTMQQLQQHQLQQQRLQDVMDIMAAIQTFAPATRCVAGAGP